MNTARAVIGIVSPIKSKSEFQDCFPGAGFQNTTLGKDSKSLHLLAETEDWLIHETN